MLMVVVVLLAMVPPVMAEYPTPMEPVISHGIALTGSSVESAKVMNETANEKEIYLVMLEGVPLAGYQGGVGSLAATNPVATGAQKLDVKSPASVAYSNYLAQNREQVITAAEETLGRTIDPIYEYYVTNNGFAVRLTSKEAKIVAELPGVALVQKDREYELLTDVGPEWIGASSIWDGSATGVATKGEGIVVGVIDTGINPYNPSFADVGGDGYDHTNPLGAGNYIGVCNSTITETYDASFPCNDKLIGSRGYPTVNNGDPRDTNGHGSHTASTAAGNFVTETLAAPTAAYSVSISGVAPHANIVAYNACCTGAALVAAIDDIVIDGVDVVNYSIGGGPYDPWSDITAFGFLLARQAGVFVATSAGNDGPGAGTVGSPANAPWVTSVGASTHNREFVNKLMDMTGGTNPPDDIEGKSFTSGYGPAPIVHAGWYADAVTNTMQLDQEEVARMCLMPFPPGTFDGEIVVCDRGVIARTGKGANVLAGGAGGYVLANDEANGDSLNADGHVLPAVHITYDDGLTLKSWLTNTVVQSATIAGTTRAISDTYADNMAAFSSRGVNAPAPDVIKPDVTAPGVDVVAASMAGIEYESISGTSMSSPHVAGAGALIKALHPSWSPAEIQSALMSTAFNADVMKEDGTTPADPFDMGSGRVALENAAKAGLVLDEIPANYWYTTDPATLNLASLGQSKCVHTCQWTRVVSSSLETAETWSLSSDVPTSVTLMTDPISFTLAPGATQVVTVTADVSQLPIGQWAFGEIAFTPESDTTADAHFPVAVKGVIANVPSLMEIDTFKESGSEMMADLKAKPEITELTVNEFGMVQATLTEQALNMDPTNGDPFDVVGKPMSGTFYITETVVASDVRLVAEILGTTAPDIDLFVTHDDNGDGMPQEDEQVCASAAGGSAEYCNITGSDLVTGTYHVLVQNWEGSEGKPGSVALWDLVTLGIAIVPGSDADNLMVTGPVTVTAGNLFDLDVAWDLTSTPPAYWYGAFDLGSDTDNPGNLGFVSVDLNHNPYPYSIYLPLVTKNFGD